MRKRRKYQEGGESRYVQPKNILNPKAPKQYPVYKQPRDPNAFYRNASPGSINEDYTIESFLLPSPALKGAGQLYKGTKAGLKRLAKEGLEDEAKLASEYATKVQSRANIAAKRDGRLLNKQRVLGQADFEDLTNDARHFYSEHGIELPPAEFDAIKHLNPHVNKAAARQALKAADAGDDVFGGLHGKATLRDARRAGLSDDEINQMRAGRLKPYTNPAKPIVGFYGANRHGGRVSYRTGSRLIPNPGFDTGVQVSDATRTRIPKNAQAALASEEYNKDLTGRSGLSEEGFRAKYNKSRARARNMPSSFDVISNQLWEGAKEPFKFIGADPDLIRKNPVEGISQALAGTLMAELPVNEMYQATKQGISGLKKALGTESGLLSHTYKVNPWAFKPQEGMMYRGLGEEGFADAIQSGVFRPKQYGYAEGRSLAERVTTPKQFGSTFYAPAEKFGVVENYGPNYLAEVPFEGNQFARRYGRKDWSWSTPRQIPINEGRLLQKDWLKGYKEVSKPSLTPKFKSEIDWAKWNSETPKHKVLMDEYNAIEESTKKAGTWMKNPDGSPLLQTYPKSRVKEYGFGGKLFKSIGDGLQNSGAFLADNALSIAGATEAANNLYTDSRFGKAAQNVSKITNQINKVAGTIGATALGGPAAGMAMGQVQNMTGNINRKPNQEYNDWDVAGQYAGSLSSMAGMFYNPAGATSSVNPKAKYGGSIRRKIAKQGGTIRPTQGGMFINEGFGIEHALGNLHEDGGIVYNDRTEVENNEKILDGNYVLTDQPYSEPYMKESISRRFDKNSKAISDRNNPDITESAMSFLKDEAIAKNEEYLESLDNMTGKYKKGGLINRRRALDFMYRKMHKQGGVLSNLGTQEGRVVTNRFVDGGLTETDLLNQEEARKMAALKQSILNQNSLPTSQRQYYIDPIQEAYDPTWMGDVYNTARNHDIAVQRANDISNDPNYAGYGQGSKGIPYKYPSPKPQKQFPWEDTLYGVASLAPAIYNMGAGLFGKTQQYNPENYITRGRLNYKPISGEETKRQINSQRAATDYQLRDAGITSRRSRLNNSYNAMQTMAQAQERIDNINTQGQLETDIFNLGLDQDNNRIRLTVADINDRNKAARQQMLAQGLSDVSEFAQGTKRDKIMKSMLTKMYGRRGGRIAW